MIPFYSLPYNELKLLLDEAQLKTDVASKLYNWYHKKRKITECELKVSKASLQFINSNFSFLLPKIFSLQTAEDGTTKFLFLLQDGNKVESVLIPFHNKYSLCISSQVGCAMNCSFCFTGTQGYKRNLTTEEIVGQFLEAYRWLEKKSLGSERILNIVFMGQGEPLHNFENVKSACEIFLSQHGTSIAAQKITVSTSGYLPGLKRWKEEMPGVNLALSLHSPFTEKRNELIPINKKFKLNEVLEYIDEIPLSKKQFVTYEYLLIEDFNDHQKDAQAVGELLAGKRAYINLIPFNPFPGSKYKKPSIEKINEFKKVLDTYKIPTLVRITKGDEVLAACGQLNTSEKK